VRHLNKSGGANAMYRGGGSIGIIGAARAGLLVAVDPDDEDRRVLAVSKSNLAHKPVSLAYRVIPDEEHESARIAWDGTSKYKARDLLEPPGTRDGHPAADLSPAVANAGRLLAQIVGDGVVRSEVVRDQLKAAGSNMTAAERVMRETQWFHRRKWGRPSRGGSGQYWTWELTDEGRTHFEDDLPPPREPTGTVTAFGEKLTAFAEGSQPPSDKSPGRAEEYQDSLNIPRDLTIFDAPEPPEEP